MPVWDDRLTSNVGWAAASASVSRTSVTTLAGGGAGAATDYGVAAGFHAPAGVEEVLPGFAGQSEEHGPAFGTALHRLLELTDLEVSPSPPERAADVAAGAGLRSAAGLEASARSALESEPVRRAAAREHWLELPIMAPKAGHTLEDAIDADREVVENEQAKLREFIKGLSPDDIKSGGWFSKLVAGPLGSYTEKVTWQYFQEKYEGVPADAIVDQRIKIAARYAALEGGLSAGAYSAAIIATLGTLGGSSPATVPAAVVTLMVDVAFITQLQLRLAYDVAVLYRIPLDLSDPEDMWKLIRVAFTIKSGEAVREGVAKAVPAMVRPVIKRFYSRGALNAAKGLPFVGKYLLQRNIIKIGIPLVGVPLAVVLNR